MVNETVQDWEEIFKVMKDFEKEWNDGKPEKSVKHIMHDLLGRKIGPILIRVSTPVERMRPTDIPSPSE